MPEDNTLPAVNVGLIGCGRWGSRILSDLLQLGCTVSVVDTCEQRLQQAAAAGAMHTMKEARVLPAVDAIVIATPSSLHARSFEEVIDRQVPIFIEKPMTTSSLSAKRLVEIACDRIFVMEKWRYHPAVQALANIARTDELGQVVGLSTQRLQWGNPHKDVDGTWILMPHDLSIAREIFGYIPEPNHVLADNHDGTVTGLFAQFAGPPWLRISVSTRSSQRLRRVELHCQHGIAVFDGNAENQIEILRAGPADILDRCSNRQVRTLPHVMPLQAELKEFLAYVQGGPPPKSNAREGYDVVCKIVQMRHLAGLTASDEESRLSTCQ